MGNGFVLRFCEREFGILKFTGLQGICWDYLVQVIYLLTFTYFTLLLLLYLCVCGGVRGPYFGEERE